MLKSSEESKKLPNVRDTLSPTFKNDDKLSTGDPTFDAVIGQQEVSLEDIGKLKASLAGFAKKNRIRAAFICAGEDCISAHICPFIEINRVDLLPVGEKCPVDTMVAVQTYDEMAKTVMDINTMIDMDVFTESYIRELVAIEIYVSRIEDKVAKDETGAGYLTSNRVGGVNTRTGELYEEKAEHYLLATKERLLNRKDKVLKSLLITPEARARFKLDKARSIADQMKEMQTLAKKAVITMQQKGTLDLDEIKARSLKEKTGSSQSEQSEI